MQSSISTSTSSASGSTSTPAALVWMRPWDSVTGTRCTRCTPPSNFSWAYGVWPGSVVPRALTATVRQNADNAQHADGDAVVFTARQERLLARVASGRLDQEEARRELFRGGE